MENFLITAQQVAILFALMGAGALSRWTKLLDAGGIRGITDFLVIAVCPCLIVNAFSRPFEPHMLRGLAIAAAYAAGMHALMIAIAHWLFRRGEERTTCVLKLSCVFSNAGFMGIPLEQAILGDAGVFYGIVFIVMFNLFFWSYGVFVMRGRDAKLDRSMFVNPGTVGLALGLAVFLTPGSLPEVVAAPVRMIAAVNTPMAMVVLGFYLAGADLRAVAKSARAYAAAFVRLVASPLVVIAALYPLRRTLDPTLMLAVVIPASAPVGALVAVFAAKMDRDVDLGAGLVSGTTLLSAFTMPAVVALAMEVLK